MLVYNPKWLQLIFYLGGFLLPLLSGMMFYFAFDSIYLSDFFSVFIFVFLGISAATLTLGFLFIAKFINVKLNYNESGFNVIFPKYEKSYRWSDISSIKNLEFLQILILVGSKGEFIYAVDYLSLGFNGFNQKVKRVTKKDTSL